MTLTLINTLDIQQTYFININLSNYYYISLDVQYTY